MQNSRFLIGFFLFSLLSISICGSESKSFTSETKKVLDSLRDALLNETQIGFPIESFFQENYKGSYQLYDKDTGDLGRKQIKMSGELANAALKIETICNVYTINPREEKNIALLHDICAFGNERMVDRMVKCGFDVNARDPENRTPLMKAVLFGNCDTIRALCNHNASLHLVDNHGLSTTSYIYKMKRDIETTEATYERDQHYSYLKYMGHMMRVRFINKDSHFAVLEERVFDLIQRYLLQ